MYDLSTNKQRRSEIKKDFLRGLKENVVVGHKVPAGGTGLWSVSTTILSLVLNEIWMLVKQK